MAKKRKPGPKKNTVPITISSVEKEHLDNLLSNLEKIENGQIREILKNPEFAGIFVEALPLDGSETLRLVVAIREAFEEKIVRKAVKKIIYKLERKGISVPGQESEKQSSFILRPFESGDPEAYVGPIDGTGSRGVLIMIPRMPKGVDIGMGLVSSYEGIIYFLYDRYSKKRAKEIKDLFFEQAGKAVEASMDHAATILERAYKGNDMPSDGSSNGYLRLRPWILENISILDRPKIYDFIKPDDIPFKDLSRSQIHNLLSHELMEFWVIEYEKLEPFLKEIAMAEESPILISEDQKELRINEIKDKTIKELYGESNRLNLKNDLEEMAYVFLKHNEEDLARISIVAASTLEQETSLIRADRFLKAYLERSLDHYHNLMNENKLGNTEKQDSSPIIITP